MRHQRKRHRIGRGHAHRKATLSALSNALIRHKRITTTLPKAKALRVYVEPLINRAKSDTTHNRRQVFRHLQDKESIKELFGEISDKISGRPGGYTRVVKLGQRAGDAAPMAMIELVDYNDVQPGGEEGGSRSRRTRRGGGRGRRRRGGGSQSQVTGQEATAPAAPPPIVETGATEDVVQTTAQTTGGAGVAEETVEAPVAEEQTTPVVERTEGPGLDPDVRARAEEVTEAAKREAAETSGEEPPAEPEGGKTSEETRRSRFAPQDKVQSIVHDTSRSRASEATSEEDEKK